MSPATSEPILTLLHQSLCMVSHTGRKHRFL
jgi:hypothetical protein